MEKIKKHIRLRSVLLINIRPTGGIQALSDMMEKDTEVKWGNSLGYVLLPFTIGLRDDPLDYIREAKATVDRKKNSLEVVYTFVIAELAMKLLGTKIASSITDRINAHTTIAFSNLVGPLEEIAFYKHPMAFLAPSSYGQPHVSYSIYNL
ncbi:O-acyltransferase WSD1 [Bienertia sinuspersici]